MGVGGVREGGCLKEGEEGLCCKDGGEEAGVEEVGESGWGESGNW